MPPADRPGDPDNSADRDDTAFDDTVFDDLTPHETIDLTDPFVGAIAQVIDLRAPGAPYTYPSSPSTPADEAATEPPPSDAGLFGVARGSAHVPTAPPDHT